MTVEITNIRTAAEAAAAITTATPEDLATLDPRTVAAITAMLRAAADLARAQRPVVLHESRPPAVAEGTAAYGAHAHIPGPPTPTPAPAAAAGAARRLFTRAELNLYMAISAGAADAAAMGAAGTLRPLPVLLAALAWALGSAAAIVTQEGRRP